MNDTYYRIFVEGTLTLKQIIYEGFEVKVMIPLSDFVAKVTQSLSVYLYNVLEEGVIFTGLNKNVPLLVIGVFQRVKRTQTGLLNINLIYVLILLLTIIIGMFIFGGK